MFTRFLQKSGVIEQTLVTVTPSVHNYASLLRGTKDFMEGKCIHDHMVTNGYGNHSFLGNLLVQMYGKAGRDDHARSVFDTIQERNAFSWTLMLSSYAHNGHYTQSLELYHTMLLEGCRADEFMLSTVLGVCSVIGNIQEGKRIHTHVLELGLESDTVVQNSLVSMYVRCGCLELARRVFDATEKKDMVSWNVVMAAYNHNNRYAETLATYHQMVQQYEVNEVAYVAAVSACCGLVDLEQGRQIHAQMPRECLSIVEVRNALINMYGKCGSLSEAQSVFDQTVEKSLVSWNALVAAYAHCGHSRDVSYICCRMDHEGVEMSKATYVSIISCCRDRKDLERVHARGLATGHVLDVVATSLIDAYAGLGLLGDARQVFISVPKNVFVWNSMIGACVRNERNVEALACFHEMELEGVRTTEITMLEVMGAFTEPHHLSYCEEMHARISACGYKSSILENTLINAYARCGSIADARRTFDAMEVDSRTAVSWNAMIGTYIQNLQDREGLRLYSEMEAEPDSFTFATVLGACANLEDLFQGVLVHSRIKEYQVDDVIATALINMYGKCRDAHNARLVFENRNSSSVVVWNAMVSAYAQSDRETQALKIFKRMDLEGIKHVQASYVCILGACKGGGSGQEIHSRIGVLDEEVAAALISMYSRCGSLESARLVFKEACFNMAATAMLAAYSHHACGNDALELLWVMSVEGLNVSEMNFTSILNACSHAGMTDEACASFRDMYSEFGIQPAVEHYVCICDVLARAGLLSQAEELMRNSPFQPDGVALKSLLNACRVQGNAMLAAHLAGTVAELEPAVSAPYILLSDIYMQPSSPI